ncbi:MAG TPA: NUDIX domain-containing protein [Actinomycetota bacterium]|nr:NUDIX domain-containing protein [Actinomycetota bacterium]
MERDGNGWVSCACGARHWGKQGAAGVFLVVQDHVLLQLRPGWAHQGGTWAIPGGARDSHESVVAAALREAREEAAIDPALIQVTGVHRLQHPDWRYDTVLAVTARRPPVSAHAESVRLEWVPVADLADWDLHPGFAASLPDLRLPRVSVVIDGANVVGSRPDGWWRDRAGAAQRLLVRLDSIAGRRVELAGQPVLAAHVEVVVEGQAVAVPDPPLDSLVRVVRAAGSGDDTIVERARSLTDVLVVTSDRALRERVPRSTSVSTLQGWLS